MGRLSAYAKNRILKLRFKKNKRIIHIVDILKKDDNIKVSRQAVSTFLKKYLETNSIYDKPRTGRKRKLTQEEIQLIGQVTRLNRDITARAIKEYLNLNVSTYTILRATKLFEWNKINPNSNDSKKAAALERQLNVGTSSSLDNSKVYTKKEKLRKSSDKLEGDGDNTEMDENNVTYNDTEDFDGTTEDFENKSIQSETELVDLKKVNEMMLNRMSELESKLMGSQQQPTSVVNNTKVDLQLINHRELLSLKNLSCSPMSFSTKILFKIFKTNELHGHNVSGKTLNKNLKAKLPLDPIRISYIKFLVEQYYDEKECKEMLSGVTSHKQDLWKSCHTAINKSILISERKTATALATGIPLVENDAETLSDESYNNILNYHQRNGNDTDVQMNVRVIVPEDEGGGGAVADDDDSTDESDIELQPKIIKQKKAKLPVTTMNRRSTRTREASIKIKLTDDLDSSEDTQSTNNYSITELSSMKELETSPNFEIELIQNIENRHVNKPNPNVIVSPPIRGHIATRRTTALAAKQSINNNLTVTKKEPFESTEASAAANIAASMKKRIVVIAATPSLQKSTNLISTTTTTVPSSIPSLH